MTLAPGQSTVTLTVSDGTLSSQDTMTVVSAGTISQPGGAGTPLRVTGTQTYAEEGSYSPTITIVDHDNPFNTATAHATAHVADAPLSASGVTATSPQGFNGTVAIFNDANPGAPVSDFSATIDWGDSHSSSATVSAGGGAFSVAGPHTYGSTGLSPSPSTSTTSIRNRPSGAHDRERPRETGIDLRHQQLRPGADALVEGAAVNGRDLCDVDDRIGLQQAYVNGHHDVPRQRRELGVGRHHRDGDGAMRRTVVGVRADDDHRTS